MIDREEQDELRLGAGLRHRGAEEQAGRDLAQLVQVSALSSRIHLLRGTRVMLGPDLAELYAVEPRALVQAVKRNRRRFPGDFAFQLTAREVRNLKSQIVISSW